ncbi:putative glycosyltransferase EpsE [compost metagenome]
MPKISVLMPVYNNEAYLDSAIESILDQSFSDFEFIIINDGSTDKSGDIIARYSDPRIKRIDNTVNCGVTESLNKGLQLAVGEFIARMDSDDFSHPNRFSRQLSYMESHPNVGVCGSNVQVMGSEEVWYQPEQPDEVKCRLLFNCCLAHPSVMLRREILVNHSLQYDAYYNYAEDYQLWTQLSHVTKLSNVPEVLLYYRLHDAQISKSYTTDQVEQAQRIKYEQLIRLGIEVSEEEFSAHLNLCEGKGFSDTDRKKNWVRKILKKNLETRVYDQVALMKVLSSYG